MQNVFFSAFLLFTGYLAPSLANGGTILRMQTDLGGVDIEIYDATPLTRDNFLFYVNGGVDGNGYDGTFIHRHAEINDSGVAVVQMGGSIFDPTLGSFLDNRGIYHIPVQAPVQNESGIFSNLRGTVAMARTTDPDSATSEFYINLVDNISLDPDPITGAAGYTVFGEVLAGGMPVIDAVAALERCKDIGYILPKPCNNFPQVPLVAIEADKGAIFTTPVLQHNIVNLWNIGIDSDNDGIIDEIEDAAPNNGDMDNNALDDSAQVNIASFQAISGDYIFILAPQGTEIQSTDVLGQTFALTTVDPFDPKNELARLTVFQGLFATKLSGTFNGASTTLTLTLPSKDNPNAFFTYGPTPSDTNPHWYEFDFDGETGAQINGNIVTLSFVDGKRGDADLMLNGEIIVSPGGPVKKPGDSDGIPDSVEDNAPNNGDGNKDGVPDSTQDHVTSLTDIRGTYITLETSPSMSFDSVQFSIGSSYLAQASGSNQLAGLNFSHGFLAFNIVKGAQGDAVDVKLILPNGESPVSYYKFGPTPADPVAHFYEFTFDGETGAEFNNNIVKLHFVDGKRGDSDLAINGEIDDPGAPALPAEVSSAGGGGGGCTITMDARTPEKAGAWWLIIVLIYLHGMAISRNKRGIPK